MNQTAEVVGGNSGSTGDDINILYRRQANSKSVPKDELLSRSGRQTKKSQRLLLVILSYPITIITSLVFIYFTFSWASYFFHILYHMVIKSMERTPLMEKTLCKSQSLMLSIQRQQLENAREELHNDLQNLSINQAFLKSYQKDLDFGFYAYNLGTLDVEVTKPKRVIPNRNVAYRSGGKKDFSVIAYYRLYKAANDHIRGMLYKFAFRNGYHEKDYSTCIGPNDCRNSGVQEKPPAAAHTLFFPARLRRYPFTFVREPLARFVSGYREVEFRVLENNKANWLFMTSKPGTAERFKEFIRLILLHNGSGKLFRYPGAEIEHVAPFIGTIHQAAKKEVLPLRLFRVENIESDWGLLAEETGQPNLWRVWNSKQLWPHQSSTDPYNSSISALDFLAPAMNMTMEQYLALRETLPKGNNVAGSASSEETSKARGKRRANKDGPRKLLESALYLRAVCRIYLSDFICGDYPLPDVCRDLHDEVFTDSAVHENKESKRVWRRTIVERITPHWLLRAIAEVPCMLLSRSPPECIGRFIHGNELYDEDNEQEQYDEL